MIRISEKPLQAPDTDPDRLRTDLARRLLSGGSAFALSIQTPRPRIDLPTDKATVRWAEIGAPFLAMARLEIPSQNVAAAGQERMATPSPFRRDACRKQISRSDRSPSHAGKPTLRQHPSAIT
jgi:hypothetical protein